MFRDIAKESNSRFESIAAVVACLGESPRVDWDATMKLWQDESIRLEKRIDSKTREIYYAVSVPQWAESFVGDEKELKGCLPVMLDNPADSADDIRYVGALDINSGSVRLIAKSLSTGRGKKGCFVKPSESEIYASQLEAVTNAYCERFGECPFTESELIQRIKSPYERKASGDYRWGVFAEIYRECVG